MFAICNTVGNKCGDLLRQIVGFYSLNSSAIQLP